MIKNWSKSQLIAAINVLDGALCTYAGVWFAMHWIPHLDVGTVSGREIVGAAMAIVTGFFLSKTCKKGTSLLMVMWTTILCSSASLFVYLDHNFVSIITIIVGQIHVVLMYSFFSRLAVENVPVDERVEYDTIQMTAARTGRCIGGVVAYLFPLSFSLETSYLISTMGIRICIVAYFILIKMKVIKY